MDGGTVGYGNGVWSYTENAGLVFAVIMGENAAFDAEVADCVEEEGCAAGEEGAGYVGEGVEVEAADEGEE